MLASYRTLQGQQGRTPFQRPLSLTSHEGESAVSGDIHAVINAPFDAAGAALASPQDWCGIMILHLNTKACRVSAGRRGTVLDLWIGQKEREPLADASRLALAFGTPVRTANYMRVALSAPEGPMGTRDYRILLEAIPLTDGRTFIHLAYTYGYGTYGAFAMRAYLATLGRDKVGFTLLDPERSGNTGRSRHIGGPRGLVERNTMRYYLAIEAYLGALSVPPPARFEKRIRDWYAAAEQYPLQLHEMGEAEYLDMKRETRALRLPPA